QATLAVGNASVAEVVSGNEYYVRGLVSGSTSVTATLGDLNTSADIDITSAQVSSMSVNGAGMILNYGTTYAYRSIASFNDGTILDVTDEANWSSDIPASLTVSNTVGTKG